MYNVSQAFLNAIKEPVQFSKLKFTVAGVAYNSDNILQGSFSITNQCTDTADITLGAVYTAELKATLRGVSVARNSWNGKTIIPAYSLRTAVDDPDTTGVDEETWEDVPLGIFTISEATWTRAGVDIVAYDNMAKFDKKVSLNQSVGYMYDFLVVACEACNVTLAHTQAEIEVMPNGNVYFNYYSENDVETWRDVISWVAQTLGGFATINRSGELEIRHYGAEAIDEVDVFHRDAKGQFSDYITKYTGISYTDLAKQTTVYTGAEVDDGSTMNLGSNPFLQTENQARVAIATLLDEIAKIRYTPFKTAMIGNPAYDLGDVVTFGGGLAGTESTCCIQKYVFLFHKSFEISGYGANPNLANARSKSDKNIAGLLQNVSSEVMQFYELRNVQAIHISENERRQIVRLRLASVANTRVEIHVNINLNTKRNTDEVTAEEIIIDDEPELKYNLNKTKATITYIIDSDEIPLHPEETYVDGKHVMHLMYILPLSVNIISYFRVYMKADDGDITIERNGVWLYASGYGIVGDGTWDGTFDLEDETELFSIPEVVFLPVADTLTVNKQTPIAFIISENVSTFTIPEVTMLGNIADRIRITMHNTAFQRVLEDYDGTEDASGRVLEDYDGTGDYDNRLTEEEVI